MRLQICHLSDIHFWTQEDYIDEKKEKICDAILSRAKRKEDILFLVSGDIAQSCSEEEYDIALGFFEYLKEDLNAKKELQSYFIFVPGNHDAILDVNDYDEENRRNEILNQKDNLEKKKMEYYQTKMCEKQKNFFDFRDLLTDDTFITKVETGNKLLEKFELKIAGFPIFINAFNTSWISQRNEKPSEIFIPKSIYEKTIHKNEGLNITMYHHPSNWMHPDDKIFFDSIIRANSDMVFVGHEHVGREEHVKSNKAEYDLEYGEVLQDLSDKTNSAFKMHYVDEDRNITSYRYKWNDKVKYYEGEELPKRKLGENIDHVLAFLPDFREWLNSFDMQVTHPKKKKVYLQDIFIFPNVEEYIKNEDFSEGTKDRITIKGEELLKYILENKYIEFSGGAKVGKTALTKMIAQQMDIQGIHTVIVDCKKNKSISSRNFDKIEATCIYKAYGKEKEEMFRQLPLNKKMIILDNIDTVKSNTEKQEIIKYLSDFYEYIVTFTSTSYEIAMLSETINKSEKIELKHCVIKEFNNKQRNRLYKKWYMLSEGGDVIVDEDIDKKVKEATNTINTLKGNGYMPCIAPNIIIILQQLEFQADRNQDRSNYGYMYEFLINKAILDMKRNCNNVSEDIAAGILINVAKYMLENHCRTIGIHDFTQIVDSYNKHYITDASRDTYLSGYTNVDLIECENDEIKFKYPYIHYYFTAKYLATNISKEFAKNIINEMSNNLQDEECGDIMIFLCHLTKEEYVFKNVLDCSKKLLEDVKKFDFDQYKNIRMNFDEYLDTDFKPEEGKEERTEKMLERKDQYEEEKRSSYTDTVPQEQEYTNELQQKLEILDAVYKSIEVMGQILKNYPGSIDGNIKIDLLREVHSLGMRSLTYTHELLRSELEKLFDEISGEVYKKIREESQKQDVAINETEIWKYIKTELTDLGIQMDNLFGLTSYSTIRRLANSLGNEELKPLINYIESEEGLSYQLMRWSIYLNEFGILQGNKLLNFYDQLSKEKSNFAKKLLKLFVYEHYFVYGSADVQMRQRIWETFKFNKKQESRVLLGQLDK